MTAARTAGPDDVLVVNEIFGPTVQGEGPSAGTRCAFLRLGGCNLTCSWCDTPYTWDWKGVSEHGRPHDPRAELHPMRAHEVLDRLRAFGVGLVVVSGGEPLTQQHRLRHVLAGLRRAGVEVEVETNGTIPPSPELVELGVWFNVSPKLRHSGVDPARALVGEALTEFAACGRGRFKFVCRDRADLVEVAEVVDAHGLSPVWIMPLGRSADAVLAGLRELADATVRRGWNLTPRLHVLAWEDRRGV
ncbi:7-carboxy-7-deazaguanine synthase QueE [Saccharothrix australiensis]|uniref:7-carboxy-7-deazaguanine synthase n=1 Tax=Saccharothrix australiensis TaxID=2072 RepID=A0A495VWY3_9PSEU|nr:7-carboxy-7-deazaguanine synthase QueE [Saccharothrix australiensis]RKT53826.1 organic radical activating enzyme [Saccharothrix australiensis]